MESKIYNYVDMVFADVKPTERSENIKSEIKQNLICKYRDMIAEGRSEEDAYAIAISSGGDLSGIVADLSGKNVPYSYNYEKQFEKLYEKQYRREKKKLKRVSAVVWPVVTCLYLLYSFLVPGAWAYSWVIWLLAASGMNFYHAFVVKSREKERRGAASAGIWVAVVALYFLLSFFTGRWDVTWLLFIVAVAVSAIVKALLQKDNDDGTDDEENDNSGKNTKEDI